MKGLHKSERDLAHLALSLGARCVSGWSAAEERLVHGLWPNHPGSRETARRIRDGEDPLGDAFCRIRTPEVRRPSGATYTPAGIVAAMTAWARAYDPAPARVVDPGCGSGRFLVAAGRAFPRAFLHGFEIDPLAALLARANLTVLDMTRRAKVAVWDYRDLTMPRTAGRSLYIGNPPYVRHHLIDPKWKEWLTKTATKHGLEVSQLAGLHVHFMLATLESAAPGDICAFVTAAEWLDVNYGKVVRDLFLDHLGGKSLHLIEPTAIPFPDAATTAVISCFEVAQRPKTVLLRRLESLDALDSLATGRPVRRERLESARRWGPLFRAGKRVPEGLVELGELCRVHRGAVTGANRVWIEGEHSSDLPDSVLYPSVTKAKELIAAGPTLRDCASLRRVIDIPADLDILGASARSGVEKFLKVARTMGADKGYVARHRKAWWTVGLREAAPILTTYMARRPLTCVRNLADARHINIAHGIYPRERMSAKALRALTTYLNAATTIADGRTYAGGLTKFEPQEVERLLVPDLKALENGASVVGAA